MALPPVQKQDLASGSLARHLVLSLLCLDFWMFSSMEHCLTPRLLTSGREAQNLGTQAPGTNFIFLEAPAAVLAHGCLL